MGLLDKFKKKEKDLLEPTLPEIKPEIKPEPPETPQIDLSKTSIDTVKIKLDLVLTEIDNLKTLNQMLNERLKAIERKLDQKTSIRYV